MKLEPVALSAHMTDAQIYAGLFECDDLERVGYSEEMLQAVRRLIDSAIPEGYVVVPVEPTEAQWGELARDIMFVLRQERPTPRRLLYHLEHLHETLPEWLRNEAEMQNLDHVISKGTCCVLIYKAMIAAKDGAANVAAHTRKPVVNGYLLEACPKCGCFGSESPCAVCKLRAASPKEQS